MSPNLQLVIYISLIQWWISLLVLRFSSFVLLLECSVASYTIIEVHAASYMESVYNNNYYYCISHAGIIATNEFRWEPQSQ